MFQPDPLQRLLCDILGHADDDALVQGIGSMTAIDWEQLNMASRHHSISPLCYRRLKSDTLSKHVPPDVLAKLKQEFLQTAYLNTILLHGLGKVLSAFSRQDIPFIPLKGVYLIEHVYDNIALRTMGDADLLVQQKDLDRIQQILLDLGYTSRPFWIEAEADLTHSLPPFSKPGCADLDIHWQFEDPGNPFAIDYDGLWQRAVPAKIAGVDGLALSPEDFLMHLCLHTAYHHRFEGGLRNLADIHTFLAKHRIDTTVFADRVREWQVTRSLYISLLLARDLLGTPIAGELLDALKPADYDERWHTIACQQIFPPEQSGQPISRNLSRSIDRPNAWQRLNAIMQQFFPSRKVLSTRYPASPTSWKIYLYYPARWLHLIRQHGRTYLALLVGNQSARQSLQREQAEIRLVEWMKGS